MARQITATFQGVLFAVLAKIFGCSYLGPGHHVSLLTQAHMWLQLTGVHFLEVTEMIVKKCDQFREPGL